MESDILNQNGLCPCLYILEHHQEYKLIKYDNMCPLILKTLFQGTKDECLSYSKKFDLPIIKNILK